MKAMVRFKKIKDENDKPSILVRGIISAKSKYDVLSYISNVGWITPKMTTKIGKKMDTQDAGEHMGNGWFIRWDDQRCLFIPRQSEYMMNLDELLLIEEVKKELNEGVTDDDNNR